MHTQDGTGCREDTPQRREEVEHTHGRVMEDGGSRNSHTHTHGMGQAAERIPEDGWR